MAQGNRRIMPHSCKHCSKPLLGAPSNAQPRMILRFPATVRQAREAAQDGCPIFEYLCEDFEKRNAWQVLKSHLFLQECKCCVGIVQRFRRIFRGFYRQPFRLVLEALPLQNMFGTTLQSFAYLDAGGFVEGCRLNAYSYIDDPAARLLPSIDLKVNSPRTVADLKNWINACSCTPLATGTETFRPTRLVDIGESDQAEKISVKRSEAERVPAYVCLSYRWGGPQPLQCTTDRLDDSGSWSSLISEVPTTFIDAMKMTRSLGYRYIWIDSLCIAQDDEQDVEREIHAMAQIYQNAAITICASTADSCWDGFLHTRPDFAEWKVPVKMLPGLEGSICLDSYSWFSPPVEEPLGTRAWAFQERLLSPRILEYGWRTARWTCSCSISYCGNQNLQLRDIQPSGPLAGLPFNLSLYLNPLGVRHPTRSKSELLQSWAFIVQHYSALRLTRPHDRLAAIGGIAQVLQSTTGVQYRAGLWDYERLPALLQWQVTSHPSKLLPRPKRHRAPSWSWAGIDDAVLIHQSEETVESFSVLAIDPVEGFGKIAYGRAYLEGPLKHGTEWYRSQKLRIGTPDVGTETQQDLIVWPDCSEEIVSIDGSDKGDPDPDLTFAAIGRVCWDRSLVRGLILRFQESSKTYTRLGLFQLRDEGLCASDGWGLERYTIA